jgi:type I restriction enzyme, S subunit
VIADLKPYPEYKESGLHWIGLVPEHWEVHQTRHIGRLLKGVGGTKEDAVLEGVPCVRYGELYTTHTYFIRASKACIRADRAASYTPIRHGDVLFAASGETIEEIGKSAVNLMQTAAVCGGDVIVLRPSISVHAPFLGYAMDCRPATNQKSTMGRGTTVKHIYPDELRSLLIPFPTLDEQAAIVRFLDWANGRLERAIRAKRKVIALLNEQKQAIIHHGVTRGLDPSVSLKPSGIPWLGEIPEHWEVLRGKYLFRDVDNRSTKGNEELLSVSHITGVTPRSQKNITMFKAQSYVGHKLCRPSDLVVNTMWAWMGALGVSSYTGIVSPAYAVYRPLRTEAIVDDYIDGLLRTRPYVSNFICRSTGVRSSRLRLYPEEFLRFPIILPPVPEQHQIVQSIATATGQLNTAITRLEGEINLLREYRPRLVADAVTGKLDVREAAALLPKENPVEITEEDQTDLSIEPEAADEEAVV